jgi:hypothetical protein
MKRVTADLNRGSERQEPIPRRREKRTRSCYLSWACQLRSPRQRRERRRLGPSGSVRQLPPVVRSAPGPGGEPEIRAFLLHLTERRVRARTFNVYVGALLFLYGVTLERPSVLSRSRIRGFRYTCRRCTGFDVERFLHALESDKHRALVMLAYGAGSLMFQLTGLDSASARAQASPHLNVAHCRSRAVVHHGRSRARPPGVCRARSAIDC